MKTPPNLSNSNRSHHGSASDQEEIANGYKRLLHTVFFGTGSSRHLVRRRRLSSAIPGLARATCALLIAALSGFSALAASPPITWGTPTNISGASDVSLTGTLFDAANFGGAGVGQDIVNGVAFKPFATTHLASSYTSGQFTLATAAGSNVNGSKTAFGAPTGPFTTLMPSAYRDMMMSASYGRPLVLTINGLTPFQTYQIELWVNDSHQTALMSTETLFSTNSTTLKINTQPVLADGLGQFVVGTFTANSSTQSVALTGNNHQSLINAVQVRAVPEPSVWAMMGAGSACLLATMHFRRRRI